MHVWLFVFSSMFSPVMEPLGLSVDSLDETPVAAAPSIEEEPMRYHGIERLLAQLEAEAAAESFVGPVAE
ncbi:MAG: hypothetical protein H6712_07625 [Myxococcales bacterium]|nr:hypothetical protein [Myxococcales bacterium]MCB9713705.1 hypothetical protein [Myxococcales bacterium]